MHSVSELKHDCIANPRIPSQPNGPRARAARQGSCATGLGRPVLAPRGALPCAAKGALSGLVVVTFASRWVYFDPFRIGYHESSYKLRGYRGEKLHTITEDNKTIDMSYSRVDTRQNQNDGTQP
jgi:hypothetical protein